jgi:hypothetical protein
MNNQVSQKIADLQSHINSYATRNSKKERLKYILSKNNNFWYNSPEELKEAKRLLKELKTPSVDIVAGGTFTIDDFSASLRDGKSARSKFIKENSNGYFSYDTETRIPKETVAEIMKIVGNDESIYRHFNTVCNPFDVKIIETGKDKEKVQSNNIYDLMGAKTITHYSASFKVRLTFGGLPIAVTKSWSEDTTLSMRDIGSFM